MAKNMPENQNGEEEVKEVRISREELKQARREAKAAKKAASEKEKLQKTVSDNKNQKEKRYCNQRLSFASSCLSFW